MATPGYQDFGGSVADVIQDEAGNALEGVALQAWTSAVGGTMVTDILDADGNSTGGVVVSKSFPDSGRVIFQAPEIYDVLYLARGNSGTRWRIFSASALEEIAKMDINSILTELAADVIANESAISTISTDLAAAIADIAAASTAAADADAAAHEAINALSSVSGNQPVFWRWIGARITSGDVGEIFDNNSGRALQITEPPILRLDKTATGPTVVTIDLVDPETGTAVEMLDAASRVIIPAGSLVAKGGSLPSTAVVNHGWGVRGRLVQAPPTGGGAVPAVAVVGTPQTKNSGATTGTSHTAVVPTGGAVGDVLLTFVSSPGSATITSSNMTQVVNQISDTTTPRARLSTWVEDWSSGFTPNFTLSASGPFVSVTYLLRNVSKAALMGNIVPHGANAVGLTGYSIPGFNAVESDFTIFAASIWYPANVDNYQITGSGPAGLATDCNQVTTRTALVNYGLWTGRGNGTTAGEAVPATALVASGGTGTAAVGTSYASMAGTVVRSSAGTGPTSVRLQVNFQGVLE